MEKEIIYPQECPKCGNSKVIYAGEWILYTSHLMRGYEYSQEILFCPFCGLELPEIESY